MFYVQWTILFYTQFINHVFINIGPQKHETHIELSDTQNKWVFAFLSLLYVLLLNFICIFGINIYWKFGDTTRFGNEKKFRVWF